MAPGPTVNSNLEETIAKVYETLKRSENKTLETKRRAEKTLEDSSKHLNSAKTFQKTTLNPNRFSESLNYTSNRVGPTIALSPQYSTVDNRRTPYRMRPSQTSISINNEEKKGSANNSKLRTIIYKTLDRLFQAPNKQLTRPPLGKPPLPPKPNQSLANRPVRSPPPPPPLTLETLKLLNQNTADTLPRRDSSSFPLQERNALSSTNEDDNSYDESASSSDDASQWEFIAPLKFEEVIMDDTLKLEGNIEKENDSSSNIQAQKTRKSYYQKNRRSSDKSKIQKRVLARNESLKSDEDQIKYELIQTTSVSACTPTAKPRLDSPVQKRKSNENPLTSAKSLPNLIEAIQELENSSTGSSICGTDTFTRNISYCPSSTLCKSVPSFSESHENDDDACSTSSSFSSLQMAQTFNSTMNRSTHESTLPVPSALCKDVLVKPINVPIQPYLMSEDGNDAKVTGITPQTFKELSEIYIPSSQTQITEEGIREYDLMTIKETEKDVDSFTSSNCSPISESSSLNASLPPPPPPLPPPIPPPTTTGNTIRGLLPLPIFTQRQKGNCVFNDMKDIRIDIEDAKKLKEKFPLKSGGKALRRLLGRDKPQDFSPEEKKFLRNIELFLRTCRISNEEVGQVIRNMIGSILALKTKYDETETERFTKLAQCLPKEDQLDKMRRNKNWQKLQSKTAAQTFISELLNVPNLHAKVACIQFSLDFKDDSSKLSKWTQSFITACEAIKLSDKFVAIINVIMRLLQSLNPDDQSKIYGFDIQDLTKLATRTSEDGTTFLQFVIEYILNRPDLIDSIDFYKTFKDLPDVTKTSIKEMKAHSEEWQQKLIEFKFQIKQIEKDNQIPSSELQHAIEFLSETDRKLKQLDGKLYEAQQSFNNCKERFGLMNSETTEVYFFESLSKFISAYQKTYQEILAQKEKLSKQNTVNNNRRQSLVFPPTTQDSENATKPINMAGRRKSCTALEIENMRVGLEDSSQGPRKPIVNPRRKSAGASKEVLQNFGETTEIGNCLLNLLTNKESDNGRSKRARKRFSSSPSKLPIRI